MQNFKSFLAEQELLSEKVLSIGINPAHEVHREKHRQEIHDMIHKAYSDPKIGGEMHTKVMMGHPKK